jgi:hypothetical protein
MTKKKLTELLTLLWRDDRGFVVSTEMIFLAVILVIGLIVGMAAYRDAVFQELGDTGSAIGKMNQSYALEVGSDPAQGITEVNGFAMVDRNFGCIVSRAATRNFSFADHADVCDVPTQSGQAPAGAGFVMGRNEGE